MAKQSIFEHDIFDLAGEVRKTAIGTPDRIAVIEPKRRGAHGFEYQRYTYRQLSADAESVAVGLREIGIVEKTRTVFMAPPSYEAFVLGVALARVGALTIWIDPGVGYLNVAERLSRLKPEAFVGLPIVHLARLVFGWGPRLLKKLLVVGEPGFPGAHSVATLKRSPPEAPSLPNVRPDDPVTILYTTGSTGPAKPALYLHKNYSNVYRTAHLSWRFQEDSSPPVDMAAFPAFGFIGLSAGGTVVVPPINFVTQGPKDIDPSAVSEVIRECGVKTLFASPTLLGKLADYAHEKGIQLASLRRVIAGGAPIYPALMQRFTQIMGEGGELWSNYGATEALPSTEMGSKELLTGLAAKVASGAGTCVGRPFAGMRVKIIERAPEVLTSLTQAKELRAGEIGEILVNGPHISPEYYQDEPSTKKNKTYAENGEIWHRLGDAGYLDEEGRLWCVGRVSQAVNTQAGPLFSLLCEPIFDQHPACFRSGLVGIPRGEFEEPVICVELRPAYRNADHACLKRELLELAQAHAATRSIKQLLFINKLPVDPRHHAKIERPKLARWAAKQTRS